LPKDPSDVETNNNSKKKKQRDSSLYPQVRNDGKKGRNEKKIVILSLPSDPSVISLSNFKKQKPTFAGGFY
jgi:hypothetical protein